MSGLFTSEPELLTTLDEVHQGFVERRLRDFIEYDEEDKRIEGYNFVIESEWMKWNTDDDSLSKKGEWESVALVPKQNIEGLGGGASPYYTFFLYVKWEEGGWHGRPIN